jgi:enolase
MGKGVTKAVANVNGAIAQVLKGLDPTDQVRTRNLKHLAPVGGCSDQ